MTDEIVDLSKLARKSRRRSRTQCQHDVWISGKRGEESCLSCGEIFPCRRECTHADCAIRRAELGRDPLVTERFPRGLIVTERRGPVVVVLIDTSPDDFVDWTVPVPVQSRTVRR